MERSILSAETMGAAASKNDIDPSPTACETASKSASEQSGPAAMTEGPSGIRVTSSLTTSMSGCDMTALVTASENFSRSTARAPPAGTEQS